jgi:hypothetical protein
VRVDGKGFREEIREVVGSFPPNNSELALGYAITNPVEAHIDRLGLGEFHDIIGHAHRA